MNDDEKNADDQARRVRTGDSRVLQSSASSTEVARATMDVDEATAAAFAMTHRLLDTNKASLVACLDTLAALAAERRLVIELLTKQIEATERIVNEMREHLREDEPPPTVDAEDRPPDVEPERRVVFVTNFAGARKAGAEPRRRAPLGRVSGLGSLRILSRATRRRILHYATATSI